MTTVCYAEHNVKVYYERTETGYAVFADNQEFCSVSVKLEFTVTNLDLANQNNTVFVVDALKKKQLLTTLTVAQKGKAYKFSYTSWTNYGDHTKDSYDTDYVYELPFAKAQSYKVHQGYYGTFSHSTKNALDITMPIGSEIHAIREGIVIKVVDHNTKNCGTSECKKYNNLIIIYHPDGTFAEYTHIKQQGANVAVGDTVTQGQLIGYSGNVGWSTGPHLHLEVFLQKLRKRVTIKTTFKTGDGSQTEILKEKNTYTKGY
jgi:murein DD-endopeptidase MepM/ murein hydrolase activator NlpD